MPQKKSKSVGNKGIAQVKRSSSPKRFYLLLLTALLGLLLFVTYSASQQIQVYQSKASGGGTCPNKCTSIGAKRCSSGNAQVCTKQRGSCASWITTKCANGCSN